MDIENAVADISHRALLVTSEVEAKAEEIYTIVNTFREFRREAYDVVSPDIAGEIPAAVDDLWAAEVSLRKAGEQIDGVAEEVAAGNRGAGREVTFPPIALAEVTNLLQVDRYPTHKMSLEEWQRQEEEMSDVVTRREAQLVDEINPLLRLIWWFVVFQGVVLTAVMQLSPTSTDNSLPACGKIWFPIALTGFGLVVTIYGFVYKFRDLKSLELTIQSEKDIIAELQHRRLTLNREGPQRFCFIEDAKEILPSALPTPLWQIKIVLILPLVFFPFLSIFSYFMILCTVQDWDKGLRR